MGGAFTEYSKEKEDLENSGYVLRRRLKKKEEAIAHFSSVCEATEYINPTTDETTIRVWRSDSSKVNFISEHSSVNESKILYHSQIHRSVTEWDMFIDIKSEKEEKDFSRPKSCPTYSSDIHVSKGAYRSFTKSDGATQNVDIKNLKQQAQKSEMTDTSTTESKFKEGQFRALAHLDILPRYKYHRFLLDWFSTGLKAIQNFPILKFKECPIIVGGEINEENLSFLIDKNIQSSEIPLTEVEKDSLVGVDILVVYFLNNETENIFHHFTNFAKTFSFQGGTLLFVMECDDQVDESLRLTLLQSFSTARMNVDFVAKRRCEVITKMTCILEKRILDALEEAQRNLYELPLTENVDTSLWEVRSIIRRLKQAACYPQLLQEIDHFYKRGTVDDMLQSFGDGILWHGYDGDTLHIITNDTSVQEKIEIALSKPEFEHIKHSIKIQDKLSVQLLAKIGEPLHGAKFVYVNNGLNAFHQDKKFATTGSLLTANDSLLVVVTSRHAFSNQENIYVLIDESVVRLGQMTINSQHTNERLCEDITLVELNPDVVPIVNERCEKLLIDATDLPTPGRISPRELKVGDIVHKRGAKTGLTTGIVKSVQISKLGGYQVESPVIQICGRGSEPFAGEGDSGSLVFQHSLTPDENILDVLAMVQSKLNVPIPNAPVVCFPFTKGCETLYRTVPMLQSLQFINV
ncbi:uncharacterized protein LOC134250434 isoform X2 [Saccostrea cucullata]|uniref:uncharacterized protein LOC134250434 isoform X2 n=1 Tax=Saccostrea cuccullata TaxID=36930 RepID=UPI002ED675AE